MANQVSNNEADYKSHVLYVVPEEANSQKALRLLSQHRAVEDDVWVQDVRMLQAPLPAWLDRRAHHHLAKGGRAAPRHGVPQGCSTCRTCTPERRGGAAPGGRRRGGGFRRWHRGGQRVLHRGRGGLQRQQMDAGRQKRAMTVDQYMAIREQQSTQFCQETHAQELISTQSRSLSRSCTPR